MTLGLAYQEMCEASIAAHAEYASDPVAWAVEKLGIPEHTIRWSMNAGYDAHEWDGTVDPLVVMAEALRDWQNVGVESATTTGKSFWAAILIYWFTACHDGARVFTFAPKEDQLSLYIWTEMRKLWPKFQSWFPDATLSDLRLRMRGGLDDSWGVVGVAVGVGAGEESAAKAQGMHAEHMLLVYEETPGIHPAILEAGFNTCTAPHNLRLAIGNPNHQLDALHLFCEGPRTVAIRISAFDHPNVVSDDAQLIPGAVSRQSIEERRQAKGETSPSFQSRVRGISPEQSTDSLIRVEWLRASALRYETRKAAGELPTRVTGKGVDVANSEHGDRACIVDFADNACIRVDAFQCPDANVLGSNVVAEAKRHGLDPRRVGVDAIGVGAGTVNEARRLKFVVAAIYAGGKPMRMIERTEDGQTVEWSPDVNQFDNLRSQMYWQVREDFRKGTIDAPQDKELWQELTAHTFSDEGKVTKVVPKDDVKAVIGRSPDKCDAFVLANWVRARAVVVEQPEERPGVSLGYDYEKRKPRERESADQMVATMIKRARPNVTAGRYNIPRR